MSKYFMHGFILGKNVDPHHGTVPDKPFCFEIHSWRIESGGIRTHTKTDRPRGTDCWFTFARGNRYYIVENYGQCQEPNGDLIWRNEDGTQGDEKAA
jgi:hypothetical protein